MFRYDHHEARKSLVELLTNKRRGVGTPEDVHRVT
jgi:hypothetical protein